MFKKIITHYITLIFFATLFSILYQGYYFGQTDQAFYIPYLKSLSNPHMYPNDPFISTWKEVYFGNLWKSIAFLLRFFPMEPLILVFHIVFRFLFFLALYFLSLEIFKKKNIAYLTLVLWFIPKPSLGFEIFYNEFVQSAVALPILLFSILYFLKNKYFLSFILLGLSFHIHPPMSGFIFLSYLIYFIYKKEFNNLLKASVIVAIIALPIIISTLLLESSKAGFGKDWLMLTKIRSGHHSFPLTWPKEILIGFVLFLTLFLVSIRKGIDKIDESKKAKIYLIFFTLFATLISGLIFSEVIPIPKIIITVPFHISSIFSVFASLFISYFIYFLINQPFLLKKIFGYFLFAILFFNNFNFIYQKSEIPIIASALLTCSIFYFFIKKKDLIKRNEIYLQIFLLTILILWIPIMIKNNINRQNLRQVDWIDVQNWAKRNSSLNSVFIVPIYESGFRVYSERGIVGDWKDGSAGYLSPEFLSLWWKRMKDFGLSETYYSDSYQREIYRSLSTQKINFLAKKYKASYIVTENVYYNFPKLYGNKNFSIYKLKYD